jgi:hypothetical protein
MLNNWKIQRKEGRVAVQVPLLLDVLDEHDNPLELHLVAENVSRDGFRFSLNGQPEPLLFDFKVGREYEITIRYARKRLKGIIAVIWKNDLYCGVRFVERDKGWIVG